ncbi:MAG: prepilin-type N-terminal cleavage/methylation domain-containing protein [Elusimicrobia bacterium]|nr:prepilin-type N-terminal cleavage/methylation domain-containing protein [Elusimicrobiota bacterium]
MTDRKGFTLAELLIAVLIFGFMISSLATIYSTANKHMFQQYRTNTIKSGAAVAMKDIVNNLMAANRIDCPCSSSSPCPAGCPGTAANTLAFAVNVDQNSGCYPISTLATAPFTPSWHYFCLSGRTLYHHTGTLAGGTGCPSAVGCTSPTCFTEASYPAFCGPGGGGTTVTQLSNMITLDPLIGALFTRMGAVNHNVYEQDQVKIVLRVFWDPANMVTAGYNLTTSGRIIDTTLTSDVKINRSVN